MGNYITNTRYRKTQKKQITLHFRSHHPMKTKVEVAKNFYRTADISSSSPEYKEESYQVVDHLLQCNGYSNPRELIDYRPKSVPCKSVDDHVILKLPYISEYISEQILKFVKNNNLPINVIFLPGMKLGDLFCCSRPYDKKRCTLLNCMICPKLPEGTSCAIMCPVYLITCKICKCRNT